MAYQRGACVFVFSVKFVLLFVFVLVLLTGFTAVLKAAGEATASLNPGQSKKLLDPFTLVSFSVASSASNGTGPKIPRREDIPNATAPTLPGNASERAKTVTRLVVPTRARPRSPHQPG